MSSTLPRFYHRGDPDGDFYALAYCAGTYTSPTGSTREAAFLVLSFSPSPEFSPLSFHTETHDGRILSYSRGSDDDASPALALLSAWYEYELPPHAWTLYPAAVAVDWLRGATESHDQLYGTVRRGIAKMLYQLRLRTWLEHSGKVRPLFVPLDVGMKNPLEQTPENEELFSTAFGDPDE